MLKTLIANKNDFDNLLNDHVKDGWKICGGLTSHVVGSTAQLCVLLEKVAEAPLVSIPRKRKAKE